MIRTVKRRDDASSTRSWAQQGKDHLGFELDGTQVQEKTTRNRPAHRGLRNRGLNDRGKVMIIARELAMQDGRVKFQEVEERERRSGRKRALANL